MRANGLVYAKLLISFYLVYNSILVPLGIYVPYMSAVVLGASIFFYLRNKNYKLNISFSMGMKALIVFFLIVALSGRIVAVNEERYMREVYFLFESIIVGCFIQLLSDEDGDFNFVPISFIFGSIISAALLISGRGVEFEKGRISIVAGFNANTLGVYVVFGIWSWLKICARLKSTVVFVIASIGGIAVFLYTIIMTASRKALFATAIIVLFWLFFVFRYRLRQVSKTKKFFTVFILVSTVAFIVLTYGFEFIDSSVSLVRRLSALEDTDGKWTVRFDLIKEALKVFIQNPVFGVGLNNFRFYSSSGLYSHNTYVELLACTGILGTVPFACSLYYVIKEAINVIVVRIKKKKVLLEESFFVSLIIVFLFLCGGQICFYNKNLMVILYLLIAFASRYRKRKRMQPEARMKINEKSN